MKACAPKLSRPQAALARGYILFEVVLAMTIFSVAGLSLAKALSKAIEGAGALNRENDIRVGLRSFLEEVRRKPLAEMATSYEDTRLGLTYTSTINELSLKDRNGNPLSDLYTLRIAATYDVGTEQREESAEVYVYKPAVNPVAQPQAAGALANGTTGTRTSGSATSSSTKTK